MDYTASPSVQHKGGITNVAHFVGDSKENQTAENDVSDIDATTNTDMPLNEQEKQGKPDAIEPLSLQQRQRNNQELVTACSCWKLQHQSSSRRTGNKNVSQTLA